MQGNFNDNVASSKSSRVTLMTKNLGFVYVVFLFCCLPLNANVTAAQQCEMQGYSASAFGNQLNQDMVKTSQLRLRYNRQQLKFNKFLRIDI